MSLLIFPKYIIIHPGTSEILTSSGYQAQYFNNDTAARRFIRSLGNDLSGKVFSPTTTMSQRSAERALPSGHVGSKKIPLYFMGTTFDGSTPANITEWFDHLKYITDNPYKGKKFDWDTEGMPTVAYLGKHIGGRDQRWWVVQYFADGTLATAFPPTPNQISGMIEAINGS